MVRLTPHFKHCLIIILTLRAPHVAAEGVLSFQWPPQRELVFISQHDASVPRPVDLQAQHTLCSIQRIQNDNPVLGHKVVMLAAESSEYMILADLIKFKGIQERWSNILRGAHIRLDDDGRLYERWSNFEATNQRISSHPSEGPQYSVSGSLVHEFLFGLYKDRQGRRYTWFQLENTPFSAQLKHFIGHGRDFLLYNFYMRRYQVGPYGYTVETDHRPSLIGRDELEIVNQKDIPALKPHELRVWLAERFTLSNCEAFAIERYLNARGQGPMAVPIINAP